MTTRQATARRSYSVQSLVRAIGILDVLAHAGGELGMQEISRETGLHISTVFRLLETLDSCKLVERSRETGKYRLGLKVLAWGTQVMQATDLRRQAAPFLRELNEETRETVHLTVRDGDAAVYLHKFDSPIPLRIYSEIGKRAPLYCTGVGKVLLSAMSQQEKEDWLKRNPLRRFTPTTITDRGRLELELKRINELGYALDNEEHEPHVRCVAAPVSDYTGQVVAAVSVTIPSVRITPQRLPELVQRVKETAGKISTQLGYGIQAHIESPAAARKHRKGVR